MLCRCTSLLGGRTIKQLASRRTRSTCSDPILTSRLPTNRPRPRPYLAILLIVGFGFKGPFTACLDPPHSASKCVACACRDVKIRVCHHRPGSTGGLQHRQLWTRRLRRGSGESPSQGGGASARRRFDLGSARAARRQNR